MVSAAENKKLRIGLKDVQKQIRRGETGYVPFVNNAFDYFIHISYELNLSLGWLCSELM